MLCLKLKFTSYSPQAIHRVIVLLKLAGAVIPRLRVTLIHFDLQSHTAHSQLLSVNMNMTISMSISNTNTNSITINIF